MCASCCGCLALSQEVWYQLSFEGYPESDAEWFPASRIRAEHPQGDELIAAFDKGLEASGQGDVALPPHAAERAAALTVGTPQVGMYARGWGWLHARSLRSVVSMLFAEGQHQAVVQALIHDMPVSSVPASEPVCHAVVRCCLRLRRCLMLQQLLA